MILSLETSTHNCSVALHNTDGHLIALKEEKGENYIHSEKLHLFIEETMKSAKLAYADLSAIAVGIGPGSFTGLRIGLSAAKGLAYTLSIPLIAANGLEILVHEFLSSSQEEDFLIAPMIDARRMEVYTAVYDQSGKPILPIEAVILDENTFEAHANTSIYLLGDGAAKALPLQENWKDGKLGYPSAKALGEIAAMKYQNQQFEDVAYLEPFYLKAFQAGKPKKLV